MKLMATGLLVLAALAGCARHSSNYPSAATPGYANQAQCEAANGVWDPVTAVCSFKR
jgi:hypothetical protein